MKPFAQLWKAPDSDLQVHVPVVGPNGIHLIHIQIQSPIAEEAATFLNKKISLIFKQESQESRG